MQAEYIELLPPLLKDLVQETERGIGFSVDVVVDPKPVRGVLGELVPLSSKVDKDVAQIHIPSADRFSPGSVFHELQHIRRFLIEGVPCLVDCEDYELGTPELGTVLTLHDNSLEHLVIVPREFGVFPERRVYWEGVMARVWARIEAREGRDLDRKQVGMACWAFLRLVMPDSPSVDVARRVLIATSALERADQFCEALFPVLGDKAAAVRVWFAHQTIPLEIASLKYFAPRENRSWEVPLGTEV